MARPREFDVDAALERAMQVFWAKGYESTSLDDLCEATGLGRSSLYAAFGDKHGLCLRALDRYEEGSAARINDALTRPVPNDVTDEMFTGLRKHWNDTQVVEIVAVIAVFGFLNRWNDTFATPLEEEPIHVGEKHLASRGWSGAKHRR